MSMSEMERKAAISALRKVPFFQDLDQGTLSELARSGRQTVFQKGEELFQEGDPCRGMFMVLSGAIKIYRSAPSGREQILAMEGPGGFAAELPLLDGEPYPASCAAIEESRVLHVPRAAFEEILRRKPELALGILRVLGRRLRGLVMLVEELSLLEVPQRLAKYLLEMSERRGPTFTLSLSNQEIANRLGTVREIVSRNLHRLAQQGAIRIEGRRIQIVDEKALRDLVEESR